jgi:cytochrome c oxidase subunit I+III
MFLPASGIISMIVPVFAGGPSSATSDRRGDRGDRFVSFGLWVHHMFATGLPALSMASSPPRA